MSRPPANGLTGPELAGLTLRAIAELGGEASTEEIRRLLRLTGPRQRLPRALNALASLSPPPVAPLGTGRTGRHRSRRWRLTTCGPRAPHPGDVLPWEQSRAAGRNARAARAGTPQRRVAAAAGMSQSSLSLFEGGSVRITAGRLEALATALGTTAGALTGDGGVTP